MTCARRPKATSQLESIAKQSSIPDDNDGLPLDQEILFGCDPTKADTDGDGIPDYAEVFTNNTLPYSRDTDNDGIPDELRARISLCSFIKKEGL